MILAEIKGLDLCDTFDRENLINLNNYCALNYCLIIKMKDKRTFDLTLTINASLIHKREKNETTKIKDRKCSQCGLEF